MKSTSDNTPENVPVPEAPPESARKSIAHKVKQALPRAIPDVIANVIAKLVLFLGVIVLISVAIAVVPLLKWSLGIYAIESHLELIQQRLSATEDTVFSYKYDYFAPISQRTLICYKGKRETEKTSK